MAYCTATKAGTASKGQRETCGTVEGNCTLQPGPPDECKLTHAQWDAMWQNTGCSNPTPSWGYTRWGAEARRNRSPDAPEH